MLQTTINTISDEKVTISKDFMSNVFLTTEMDNCIILSNVRMNQGDLLGAIECYYKYKELRVIQKDLFPNSVESTAEFDPKLINYINQKVKH